MTAWGSVADLLGGDLEDVEFLGRGSSGSVYRAVQSSLGRTVAVKVFRQFADDADRVLAEARAQAGLSWHGNVVSLYGQGVTPDGFPYLVMEYASGGSLKDRIEARGPLGTKEWASVGRQLASALAAAHEAGVVHCDVKPSNVLFAEDGTVRLADFGIAKATGGSSGTIESIEGSLGYVAPELLDGEKPRPASDVYSLALTLAFAASGRAPLDEGLTVAQAVAAVNAGVPTADVSWPTADPSLSSTLDSACATGPSARPGAPELARLMEGSPAQGTPDPSAERTSPAKRAARIIGVAAVLVAVALLGALIARSPGNEASATVAAEPAFDLCAEYETYVDARTAVFDGRARVSNRAPHLWTQPTSFFGDIPTSSEHRRRLHPEGSRQLRDER
ncbi:MAG: serine/threonine-protein kinase [Microthrixaceae bacterium]